MLPRSRSRTRVGSWNDFETRGEERGQLMAWREQDRVKEPDAAEEKEKDAFGRCRGEVKNAEPNRAGYRCIGRWLSRIRARSTLEEFFFPSPLPPFGPFTCPSLFSLTNTITSINSIENNVPLITGPKLTCQYIPIDTRDREIII